MESERNVSWISSSYNFLRGIISEAYFSCKYLFWSGLGILFPCTKNLLIPMYRDGINVWMVDELCPTSDRKIKYPNHFKKDICKRSTPLRWSLLKNYTTGQFQVSCNSIFTSNRKQKFRQFSLYFWTNVLVPHRIFCLGLKINDSIRHQWTGRNSADISLTLHQPCDNYLVKLNFLKICSNKRYD
jgi:hypothetical protein